MTTTVGVFTVLEQLKRDILIEQERVLKNLLSGQKYLGVCSSHHKTCGSLRGGQRGAPSERGVTVGGGCGAAGGRALAGLPPGLAQRSETLADLCVPGWPVEQCVRRQHWATVT